MEIERKYLVRQLPEQLSSFPCHHIEQAYLSTSPVIRIRRLDDSYILTYKSGGLMARQEVELPLTKESYAHLLTKADGTVIKKDRYVIPLSHSLNIELDLFQGALSGFLMAEVEFSSIEEANTFTPPAWFGEDVTMNPAFHNSNLSAMDLEDTRHFLAQVRK
ncbi:MAG: CYTH domain-containing protein [Lachnospiraceae bacterium]|nr:CYTH domain-containing protein [Lachnospiraceae bacterium]